MMYSVRGGGASPGGCRRVRLWWVKHRWGLVVLVVLVGGTGNAGGTGGGARGPWPRVVVGRGGSGEYGV